MESQFDRDRAQIRLRGQAPSRQTAAQIRADYKALLDEIQRLRRERGNTRFLLARLALGEVVMGEVIGRLDLQDEIDRTVATNKANEEYSASLREGLWWGDEPDDDDQFIDDVTTTPTV
jgi:hypothetical protein